MSNCQHASQARLSSILNGAIGLRQLILSYYSPVCFGTIYPLSCSNMRLHDLVFPLLLVMQLTPSLDSSLQKLSKLRYIKLDGCHATLSRLKSVRSSCISLKELSLSKCPGVTEEVLSFIMEKHKDLMKLDITCCRMITDVSLASFTSSCTSLTSLRMESYSQATLSSLRSSGPYRQ